MAEKTGRPNAKNSMPGMILLYTKCGEDSKIRKAKKNTWKSLVRLLKLGSLFFHLSSVITDRRIDLMYCSYICSFDSCIKNTSPIRECSLQWPSNWWMVLEREKGTGPDSQPFYAMIIIWKVLCFTTDLYFCQADL